MRVYEPPATTSALTIQRYRDVVGCAGRAELVAQEWTDAGFGDQLTARWLTARCFDARAERAH